MPSLIRMTSPISVSNQSRFGALLALVLVLGSPSWASAADTGGSVRFVPPLPKRFAPAADELTALDRYVAKADTNFAFRVVSTTKAPGGTVFVLELTSQAWLTPAEVDRSVWKHSLVITRPDEVTSQCALLFIGGGGNDKPAPKGPDGNVARLALDTKSVVAELRNIPNQPVVFFNDGQKRVEDDLIAYTWDKYLRTGDERWPARLPMTKGAVRAMDAVTAFCASEEGGKLTVDRFVVAGGSKRGWTTWTTAAVDHRVVGIVPIVIDVLNMEASMQHHYAAYGFFSPAVGDYVRHDIMNWIGTPEFRALERIEEPYQYRKRFVMPKLVLNAAGDQFFLPDSSRYYYDDLPGPKYLRYVPNADHSLKGSDAWESLQAFYTALETGKPLPTVRWKLLPDGTTRAETLDTPVEVKVWQATNPGARDFRLETLGPKWTSTPLAGTKGVYNGSVAKPAEGWTAFMIEFTFSGYGSTALKLTTPIRVLPDTTKYHFEPMVPDKSRPSAP